MAPATRELLPLRLHRQQLHGRTAAAPTDIVRWFGALQAQDYLGSLWALGLRTRGATDSVIESAIATGSVIRTHVFRGTWQYVAREDVRWMLDLVAERVLRAAQGRFRQLELDARTLRRSGEEIARALAGGRQLTRGELVAALTRAKIRVHQRLIHILAHAELSGIICSGGRRGKQATFALLDERVPREPGVPREEALERIALRYYQSRGPATERDFAWWTGLSLTEARLATELARPHLESRQVHGTAYHLRPGPGPSARATVAHLLPPFDEYLIAYQDRSAMVEPRHARHVNSGGGLLNPVVLIDGRVRGTWKRALGRGVVRISIAGFGPLSGDEREAVAAAAERYAGFLGLEAHLVYQGARGR